MSESVERKVLLDVEIKSTEALKNLTALKGEIDNLKKKQKELDTSTEEGRKEFEVMGQQVKALNKEYQANQKEIQNNIKFQNQSIDSLDAMKATLSLNTAEYNKLSKAQRESAKGKELQKSIADTTKELKKAEEALGNHRRSVGDYAKGMQALPGPLGSATSSTIAFGKSLWALVANPIGAVLAAIVGVLALLFKAFKSTDTGATAFASALKAVGNVMEVLLDRAVSLFKAIGSLVTLDFAGFKKNTSDAFSGVGTAIKDAASAGWEYEQEMDRIKDREADMQIENAKLRAGIEEQLNLSKDRTKSEEERLAASEKAMEMSKKLLANEKSILDETAAAEEKRLASLIQNSEMTIEQKEKQLSEWLALDSEEMESLREKDAAFADFYNKNEGAFQNMMKLRADSIARDQQFFQSTKRMASETSSLQKQITEERIKLALDTANAEISFQKRTMETMLKSSADYYSDDFATKQEYERKLFALSQESERAKLDAQLKYGTITRKAYEQEMQVLAGAQTEFAAAQMAALEGNITQRKEALMKMLEKDTEQQIADVKQQYSEALDELNELEPDPDRRAYFTAKIQAQQSQAIEEINRNSIAKQVADMEKEVNEYYKGDILKYSTNARKRTQLEIQAAKEKIARLNGMNIDASEEEVNLMALEARERQIQYNAELVQAGENARAIYEAKKAYLEAELKAEKDNADAIAEIRKEMADNERQYTETRISDTEAWANKTIELAGNISSALAAFEDAKLQKLEESHDREKESLQKQLDRKLITQDQYDQKVANLDKKLDREKAKIARKQAIREKALQATQIIVNTATAIMKAVAAMPLTGGMPWTAIIAAIGAAQMATVLAAPLPKASRGMLLRGKKHAQGGIPIEAEDGEAIINARSTSMYRPLLSAINEAGGGVKFATGGIPRDGGYAVRSAMKQSSGYTAQEIERIVRNIKVYTSIEDVRRGEKRYAEVEDRANY